MNTQLNFCAKPKFKASLKTKAETGPHDSTGTMVQRYMITSTDRRCKWFHPKPTLSVEKTTCTATISPEGSKSPTAALQCTRLALPYEFFATALDNVRANGV